MRTFGRSLNRPPCPSSCTIFPSRTIRELADDTLARLAESQPVHRIEGWDRRYRPPDALASLVPPGFRLLSGDDATALAFIANGGDGCISMISNVAPDLCQVIFSSCRQGRLQSARYLQSRLAPLTAALTKESPAALKYALCLLGFMSPDTRLPIVELADAAKAEVASAIAAIGDEDIACACESWRGRRLHKEAGRRIRAPVGRRRKGSSRGLQVPRADARSRRCFSRHFGPGPRM